MRDNISDTIKAISIKHFLFVLFLSFIIIYYFIFLEYRTAESVFKSYVTSCTFVFACISLIFIFFISISLMFKRDRKTSLAYSCIILSALLLLVYWRPYDAGLSFAIPLVIILSTQITFFIILSRQDHITKVHIPLQKRIIFIFIILYFAFFSYIGIRQLNAFSFFNPRDFAIYNQTFWNTVHGRFFLNSSYGSNFACHNSLFFLLLVPFYYILPSPLTLLLLKILLLSLSAIPFYLIAKYVLRDNSVIPLTLAFLFYPFLVSQNLTPPHEISYAPFFILFAYYFFRIHKFAYFILFLILSVSIKEHVSLLAIMFGLLAIFNKKSAKWIFTPILLGSSWLIFSLAIISYFQRMFHSSFDSAWFLIYSKNILSQKTNILSSINNLVATSNIGRGRLNLIFPIFSSLGIIPALLSTASLLGLPEFLLNILSDRPALLSPLRHYNMLVACFLLIGTIQGVKRISNFKWRLNLKSNAVALLLSIFILSSALIHSYLWVELIKYPKNNSSKVIKDALSIIPVDAFVTAPANLAIQISNRKQYSIIQEGEYGDYILIDKNTPSVILRNISNKYMPIFNKEGIIVFKKTD